MMAKLIVELIIILTSLITTCYSEDEEAFDVLNIGHQILGSEKMKADVSALIDDLWSDTTLDSDVPGPPEFEPSDMIWLEGFNESSASPACLAALELRHAEDVNKSCPVEMKQDVEVLMDSMRMIDVMNEHIMAINSLYTDIFKLNKSSHTSEPFKVTDNFYKFITKICQDPSTCIFHRLAGHHLSQRSIQRRPDPTSALSGLIYYIYRLIIFNLLKGYAADLYRLDHAWNRDTPTRITEKCRSRFIMHTHTIATIAIPVIAGAPRDITRAEPLLGDHAQDPPYMELQWYLGQVIVHEANLNPYGSCSNTCADYQKTRFCNNYPLGPDAGKSTCLGTISQCYHQPLGDIYPPASHSRRYGGITTSNGSYGIINSSDSNKAKAAKEVFAVGDGSSGQCDVCTCLCDDHGNPDTVRSFSLREVTTNITDNMAITGLRLIERNGMIYIKIRQGKLENIDVVQKTQWKRVQMFNKSAFPEETFTLRFPSQNSVNLDTISVQKKFVREHILANDNQLSPYSRYVLTGVKFVNQNGSLGLAIKLTAFNVTTQKFEAHEWNNWIMNKDVENRQRINIQRPDVSSKTNENVQFIGDNYSVQFQATDNQKDFGQSTVPFFDHRAVFVNPTVAVAGAGLFYKGKVGYGGVIGLKLISIDYSILVDVELVR